MSVGNQLPILLISFTHREGRFSESWESVTNPLDKLCAPEVDRETALGISYQSS